MPEADLVFKTIIILIFPFAIIVVLLTSKWRERKAAAAQTTLENARLHFLNNLGSAIKKSTTVVLNCPNQVDIRRIPQSMHNHAALGKLQMYFTGDKGAVTALIIGCVVLALFFCYWLVIKDWLAFKTIYFIFALLLAIVICAVLTSIIIAKNTSVILFYERGMVLMEKPKLTKMQNAVHTVCLYSDIYGVDVGVYTSESRANPFQWACRFTFGNTPPFYVGEHDYKSLNQLAQCLSSAGFQPVTSASSAATAPNAA